MAVLRLELGLGLRLCTGQGFGLTASLIIRVGIEAVYVTVPVSGLLLAFR